MNVDASYLIIIDFGALFITDYMPVNEELWRRNIYAFLTLDPWKPEREREDNNNKKIALDLQCRYKI